MTTSSPYPQSSPSVRYSRLARFAWIVLAVTLAVIAWGAVVRATGSGAGCGSHWPLCNGEVVPRDASTETLIEFSHRATSGIAFLAVLALLVWALRVAHRGHPVRGAAIWSMILMIIEAAIGAGLVLFELVADNASMARAMFMATHLANTFLLLAAITLTAHFAGGGEPMRIRRQGSLSWLFGVALVGMLVLGASGAVAALGDTLFPASSLQEALQQDLSPTSHVLIQLRILHPVIALIVALVLVILAQALRSHDNPQARRWARVFYILLFVQLAAGGINVLLLAPVWMQIVHLLLADFLWISLVMCAAHALLESRVVAVKSEALPVVQPDAG